EAARLFSITALHFMNLIPWQTSPTRECMLPRSIKSSHSELLHIDLVLPHQLPKRAPLLLRCLCSFRDVSSVRGKQALYVVDFELIDDLRLHFLKRQLCGVDILV